MQYGSNALGELVSLLNDGGLASLPQKPSPPHHSGSSNKSCTSTSNHSSSTFSNLTSSSISSLERPTQAFSRKSSCSTSSVSSRADDLDSPAYSPITRPTPLLRFDSTSTQQSSSLQTPSPMTPVYSFDPLDQNKNIPPNQADLFSRPAGPYFTAHQPTQQQLSASQLNTTVPPPLQQLPQPSYLPLQAAPSLLAFEEPYPLQPPAVQFAYATDLIQPTPPITLTSPTSATARQSTGSANASSAAAGNKTVKKKYPCPHAARYNCSDTFTTSGHAARHGKKHTGEKNIHCPTCNKAFTRKDNMKQHERTHRTNRDQTSADSKRGSTKGMSSDPVTSEDVHMSDMDFDVDLEVDSSLGGSSKRRKMSADVDVVPIPDGLPAPITMTAQMRGGPPRPTMERTVTGDSQDGEGESPGLDALAMAAGMS